jgi:UDP-glucose 4-epimerase
MLPRPISPYAVSELATESYARAFYKTYGLETVCLRYFNVYGPRQSYSPYTGAITIFMNQLLNNQPVTIFGDGKQTRDFVYVEDVASANMLALRRKEAAGDVFNIATGTATSVNQLVRILMRIVGKTRTEPLHLEPKPGEIKHSCASIEKAKKVLGYNPIFAVDNGLRQLVKWYTSKPCKSSQGKKRPSR